MPAQRSLRSEDILNLMEIPGLPGLFVLSPFEHPVNVMSQQLRATNLVYAIDETRVGPRSGHGARPVPQLHFAIVGAGAAGCTAAAYALLLGHRVTLLERETEILPLLRKGTRHVDPTLYEWPEPGWTELQPSIPVLRWPASKASDLAHSLTKQIESWQAIYKDDLQLFTNVHVYADEVAASSGKLQLAWRPHVGSMVYTGQFDAVVLAVGFGPERPPPFEDPRFFGSYWTQKFSWVKKSTKRVLIIGNGDGGYADLIQVCLIERHVGGRFREWMKAAVERDGGLIARVTDIEAGARQVPITEVSEFLSGAYTQLNAESLDQILEPLVREIELVHVGRSSHYLNPRTYPLNRLLVSRICAHPNVRYSYSTDSRDTWNIANRPLGMLRRSGKVVARSSQDGRTERFDGIVYRAGPEFTLRTAYPTLFERCKDIEAATRLGLSRRALWSTRSEGAGPGYFRVAGRTGLRLYSDLYDPPVQEELQHEFGHNDAWSLVLGRLRLHCLLYDRVILTDAQVLDGCLLGSLSVDDFRVLSPRLEFQFRHGSVEETLLQMASGQVMMSSVPAGQSRLTLAKLAKGSTSAEHLVEAIEGCDDSALRTVATRVRAWSGHLSSSGLSVWTQTGQPTVLDDADPGHFHSTLTPAGRELLEAVFEHRNEARSVVLPRFDNAVNVARDEVVQIRHWYQRAYNKAVARKVGCGAVETVWVGESGWDVTSAGHGISGPDPDSDEHRINWRLGRLTPDEFADMQESLEENRLTWMLGRQTIFELVREVTDSLGRADASGPRRSVGGQFGPWISPTSTFTFDEIPWHFDRDGDSNLFALSEWETRGNDRPLAITYFTRGVVEGA